MNKLRTTMKLSLCALALGTVAAQGAQFFRIAGPVATTITALSADGHITWTNSPTNVTFTVQTTQSLLSPINWVDYLQVPVTNVVTTQRIYDPTPPSGMTFIPAGTFTMGNSIGDSDITDASPANVYVSAFYMDVNLVTYSLWTNVCQWAKNNGYGFVNTGAGKATNHPVQTVDWYDLVKWSNARSQQAGLTPVYYTDAGLTHVYTNGETDAVFPNWPANGYRLPTEAEYEKAARGGLSGLRFPWGNTIDWSHANYRSDWTSGVRDYSYDLAPTSGYDPAFTNGLPCTSPVGSFAANDYCLYDMEGNVAEWCWDWYGKPYGQPTPTNPNGPSTGSYRVLRGGPWNYGANRARCAYRGTGGIPNVAVNAIGFRCVRGL